MKVSELVEILRGLPSDLDVVTPNGEISDQFVDLARAEVRAILVQPTEWADDIYETADRGAPVVVIG